MGGDQRRGSDRGPTHTAPPPVTPSGIGAAAH